MPRREMKVDGGLLQIAVPQQNLDGAHVRTRFQKMGSEAVAQSVGMNLFLDASSFCSVLTGMPGHLGVDRPIAGVPTIARKQPNAGLAPQAAPILPQGLEQFRAEHHVPVLAAFTAPNVDDHALTIDVGNLQMCQLGAANAGRIERHSAGRDRMACSPSQSAWPLPRG